jgi:hypothetical protein
MHSASYDWHSCALSTFYAFVAHRETPQTSSHSHAAAAAATDTTLCVYYLFVMYYTLLQQPVVPKEDSPAVAQARDLFKQGVITGMYCSILHTLQLLSALIA